MNIDKSLVINLSKITQKPKEFSLDHTNKLLNEVLKDLIGQNPYKIDFSISRIGDGYELKGKFNVTYNLLCSQCAVDFTKNVEEPINEIFIIQEKTGKYIDEHSSGGHQLFEEELDQNSAFCNMLESEQLDIGEFCHEIIALTEPLQAKARPDCSEDCPNLSDLKEFMGELPDATEDSPFSVLKNLKM